jgi:hypothetical protein
LSVNSRIVRSLAIESCPSLSLGPGRALGIRRGPPGLHSLPQGSPFDELGPPRVPRRAARHQAFAVIALSA